MQHETNQIENKLLELADCEQQMDGAERDVEVYRIRKTGGIFKARSDILKEIPQFWYIVLAENDDFSDYIRVEDLKYLESIKDIYVYHDADSIGKSFKKYSITITFAGDNLVPSQTVTKEFEVETEDGEDTVTSKPVDVQWPEELNSINPHIIKKEKGKDLSKEDKKNYRLGMKSFFAWFAWTGLKPGKEFRSGEDLATLIVEDLYPYAVKYYTEALPGVEGDNDTSDPEELDIDSEDDDSNKREGEEDDNNSKRQKV